MNRTELILIIFCIFTGTAKIVLCIYLKTRLDNYPVITPYYLRIKPPLAKITHANSMRR